MACDAGLWVRRIPLCVAVRGQRHRKPDVAPRVKTGIAVVTFEWPRGILRFDLPEAGSIAMSESVDRLVATIHHELASLARDITSHTIRDILRCGPLTIAEQARDALWRLAGDDGLPEDVRRHALRGLADLPDF